MPSPLLASAAVLALVLLAACGSSNDTSTRAAAAKEQKAETQFSDFAKCLRDHGIDAEVRPGGHGLKIMPGADRSAAAAEAAEKDCARYRPAPQTGTPSPQQRVEIEETTRRFAKCMREHGVELKVSPDGNIEIHAGGGSRGAPNPENPAFRAAQAACQKLLPGGKAP